MTHSHFTRCALVTAICLLGSLAKAHAQSIAITFDDGFHVSSQREQAVQDNKKVLSTLRQHAVKSMLFPAGFALSEQENLALVHAWSHAGHAIGNHTFSHLALGASNTEQFLADTLKSQGLLEGLKGWCPQLRFPYLDEGQTPSQHNQVMQWLGERGYGVAGTTIAIRDWEFEERYHEILKSKNSAQIKTFQTDYINHILNEIQNQRTHWQAAIGRDPNHVLLLHTNQLNAAVLNPLLTQIKNRGWTIVSPNTAFSDPIYWRGYTAGDVESTPKITLKTPICG